MELDVDIEELIDELLTEIAFSGAKGCSVSALLRKIGSFYNNGQDTTGGPSESQRSEVDKSGGVNGNSVVSNHDSSVQKDDHPYDLSVCSVIWNWLVARSDVSVGPERRFNHLLLDDILALPEEKDPEPSADNVKSADEQASTPAKDKGRSSKVTRDQQEPTQATRPRLHVSEERQWNTLAGHGPDNKRIPLFEWKALVDIASSRENGILQGDLVRLTGQDKRSLPTRTDALARKGYIIKQSIILRGCRSSKLWLAKFSESAKQGRDGLNFDKVDLTKETLTKDLAPVPFSVCWNGERLDYIAIAQAFNAVLKAWGIMRYCDMRTKLDAKGVPQMRALAKTSRWFTNIGAATFVAARFANGQRLFKDCVKFIREPTAEEWRVFRTTPSAHIKAPSARLGKRGQASRARYNKSKGAQPGPHSQAKTRRIPKNEQPPEPASHELIPSLWSPYEPMVNTAFKIIERAGTNGSSNAKVGRSTLGHNYRKYTAALTAVLSQPNSQPDYLQHLDVISQLTRLGKTMTYQFFSANNKAGDPSTSLETEDGTRMQEAEAADPARKDIPQQKTPVAPLSKPEFSQILVSKFAKAPTSSLYHINRTVRKSTPKWGGKRKRVMVEELSREESAGVQEPPTKMPRLEEPSLIDEGDDEERPTDDHEMIIEPEIAPTTEPQQQSHVAEISSPSVPPLPPRPPRSPGVYRELDNTLDPPGKKGRRKKSLVLAFRHDALKDPSFLERRAGYKDGSVLQIGPTGPADSSQVESQPVDQGGSTAIPEAVSTQPKRKVGRGGKFDFRCDKCGSSWKNSNGLEYHLTKSRSSCNPTYVAPAIPPPKPPRQLPKPKPVPEPESSNIPNQSKGRTRTSLRQQSLDRNETQDSSDVGGRRILPSKRARPSEILTSDQSVEDSSASKSIRGSVILQDLEAYNIIDHRRRRGNSGQVASRSVLSAVSQVRQASHTAPRTKNKRNSGTNERGVIPDLNAEQEETGHGAKPGSDASPSKPKVLEGIEKVAQVPANNHSAIENTTGDGAGITTAINQLSKDTRSDQTSAPKKIPKRSNPTVGTLRRERTNHIIQHLLENNDGIFPGQRSVYQAMVSIWAKRHRDIEPPDWKVCQNVVNRMEKAGTLIQMHFCFLNEKGKLEECVVLGKTTPGQKTDVPKLAAEPKVVAMKNKMREMFPEPYIPESFSLSQEEDELFGAIGSRRKDASPSNNAQNQPHQSSIVEVDEGMTGITEDVEVLQYPAHVTVNGKRPAEDGTIDNPTVKRARTDASMTHKPLSASKPVNRRDRRDHREYWEAGKIAKYIWQQSQIEKWGQKTACLQDFSTGTWSVLPQGTTSSQFDINMVLSSERRHRNKPKIAGKASRPKATKPFDSAMWDRRYSGSGDELVINDILEHPELVGADRFVKPSISTSFIPDDSVSEDEDEDTIMIDARHDSIVEEDPNAISNGAGTNFARRKAIRDKGPGYWPLLPSSFFEENSSFVLSGDMPSMKWFIRENLPQCAGDIIKTFRGKFQFNSWADPLYGKFLREVSIIEEWEKSPDGSRLLLHGSITPDFDCIFVSLSPDISRANMEPVTHTLEWPRTTQYTADNIPDDIKNSSPDDENVGVSLPLPRNRGRPKKDSNGNPTKRTYRPRAPRTPKKVQAEILPRVEIQYKTRQFGPIPILHRGRVNRPAPNEDKLGLNGETNLIAAFVVFQTLLGGVEKKVDIGLILKTFPQYSHSFLRKFWPRASKERKTYIDALTKKFQSSFIEAYEKGEVKPLNYDDLESYDWRSLVIWATKLETHEKVKLPNSRRALQRTNWLEDQANEIRDWRDTWYRSLASVYARVAATASNPVCIPLSCAVTAEEALISRARSWVRALCVTPITRAKMPEEIRAKLLKLIGRDEDGANKLLKKVVDQLTSERIAARSKGKIFGQALRLHGVFSKQLEKAATVEKFYQAVSFKTSLDQTFRNRGEFDVPYLANDGTIMATINLQAHGRIRIESIEAPHIPFGFEPKNYDGRTFPKSYYHFKVKLLPTETYVFDEDLPVLEQVMDMEPPTEGPREEIPLWVDFFGNLNKGRWITYLGMMVLGMATKGPLTEETASVLMKPFVEPFEAKLIMDWTDKLGILQRVDSDKSATVSEWWWLVVGKLAQGYRQEQEAQAAQEVQAVQEAQAAQAAHALGLAG
ncbi:hypothetical protein F5B19DRAFT_454970 [Rostrohypoxylon terebratum]|nr:hypothetical protein F5B19DRAFT_454970 [Rostrohypoxylon terebratum]